MPTDERREVAARLRELADENTVTATSHLVREIFKELGGEPPAPPSILPKLGDLEAYDQAFLYRLADLIEPESERTCCMTKKGPEFVLAGWWECSECGPVYPPCNDEIAVWALQKCPRCGAKVVSE